MKNTEIAFYPFKQYLSIDIYMDIYRCTSEVMENHVKYFVFFPCFWRTKLLNHLKNEIFFWQFQEMLDMFVTYVMYLNIGRDDDDYDDGESSNEDYYT